MLNVVDRRLHQQPSGTGRMIALLKRLSAPMRSRKAQLGLAVRVRSRHSLAIATAFNPMLPLWAVLTSLIVTQMSVGRSLNVIRDYNVRNGRRRDLWRRHCSADSAFR
jgi:hypothetical protein